MRGGERLKILKPLRTGLASNKRLRPTSVYSSYPCPARSILTEIRRLAHGAPRAAFLPGASQIFGTPARDSKPKARPAPVLRKNKASTQKRRVARHRGLRLQNHERVGSLVARASLLPEPPCCQGLLVARASLLPGRYSRLSSGTDRSEYDMWLTSLRPTTVSLRHTFPHQSTMSGAMNHRAPQYMRSQRLPAGRVLP